MPSPDLTLEIILEANSAYSEGESMDLPVSIHIHKRLEQFRYLSSVYADAAPISCLRNNSVSSLRNLLIVNKAHTVLANSPLLFEGETRHDRIVGTAYSSAYADIVATREVFTDSKGKTRPLFYRHALPDGVVEASLTTRSSGNKQVPGEGYVVDIEAQSIFTNHRNYFDPDSHTYKLFFVSGSTDTGEVFNTLLNPVPAVKEATWEDIDLTTGALVETYPLFTKTPSGRGYTFYFNKGDMWFVRLHDKGLIQPRRPRGNRPDSPWFLRITNGDMSAVVNDKVRHYRVPEYNTQPFIPYKPVLFGTREDLLFVNRRILQATRKNLSINLDKGLHLDIQVEDSEGNLIKYYSTDVARQDERVFGLEVFVETDKIASWDNPGGFIQLSTDVLPGWNYYARYYYEADDLEYTLVNLNPLTNKRLQDHIFVFYCVPDVNDADRAIHHLVVDYDGVIVEASQNLGLAHPNLQLRNLDDSFNANTVVGMRYFSETEDNFISTYAAGFPNDKGYLILAEVCGVDTSVVENQIDVDVRRPGGVIAPSYFANAIQANARILQSKLGYGEQGQVVPEVNVVVLEPPLTLLEDYGGLLTQDQAEILLRKQMNVAGYAVINWVYPKTLLTGTSLTVGQINLVMTWEGTYTYRIYRRLTSSDVWTQVFESISPVEGVGTVLFTDTDVTSGQSYQYAASLIQNGVEFPMTDPLVISAR